MKEYKRQYPQFSLCGLNCGLCPRHQTDGSSKCPGCGGADFYQKHPSCGIIACSQRNGGVEFCFECAAFPCERYTRPNDKDSFITYQHVLSDFELAKTEGIETYIQQLDRKMEILAFLISNRNDGRKKTFYCTAVNLLPLEDLEHLMANSKNYATVASVVEYLQEIALKRNVELTLRK